MKRPHKIDILGQSIRIYYVKDLGDNLGEYDYEKTLIRIQKGLNDKLYLLTLIHEAIHALSDRVGINQVIDDKTEEIVCETISTLLIENFNIEPK